MMHNYSFSDELRTSSFEPAGWSDIFVYGGSSPDAWLVLDGCSEHLLNAIYDNDMQSTTELVNNPVYLEGSFSIRVNPSECLKTTVTYNGSSGTVINFIPNGEDHGVKIIILNNFFDIPYAHVGQPILLSNIESYMGPYSRVIDLEECYLQGTVIETPSGYRPIETLKTGDEITVHDREETAIRTIRFIGCGQANAITSLSDDLAGWPVRVLQGALADNVPFQDMLITAEHCLCLQGRFIPVRMLVNGKSIFYDKTIPSYNYYHIETDPHSVIRANGVLSETLMDQGHEHQLYHPSEPLPTRLAADWRCAAAPLETSRSFVEPLYRHFAERAGCVNDIASQTAITLTMDHGLYLLIDEGKVIEGHCDDQNVIHFPVSHHVGAVYLMSQASRPCDAIGPFVDDRRLLGVLVGAVVLTEGGLSVPVTSHLGDGVLSGWQDETGSTMRWTCGNAFLPLPPRHYEGTSRLSVQIIDGGPYVIANALSVPGRRFA